MKAGFEDVSQQLINKAYGIFLNTYYPASMGKGLFFWKFLGMNETPVLHDNTPIWTLPHEAAAKVRALAGPHGETYIKVMEINGAVWNVEVET